MKRIPFPCDFCGQVVSPSGRLNYSDTCNRCAKPRQPRTVLIAVRTSVEHPVRRVA